MLDAFSVQEFLIFWEVARRVIQFSNKAQILFFECFLTYDDNKYYIIKHIDITHSTESQEVLWFYQKATSFEQKKMK